MFRFLTLSLFALTMVTGLSACSDTWQGAKQDTGDNMQTTGKALEKSGTSVKK